MESVKDGNGNGDDNDPKERHAEPQQPPVDGPSSGSGGEPWEGDLGSSSYDDPGSAER
jgi:hypothetical protein